MAKPTARERKRRQKRLAARNSAQAETAATIENALQFQKQGDLATAEQMYRAVLKQDSSNPDAWHLLGMTLYSAQKYDDAIQCLNETLALTPHHPDVLTHMGVVLRGAGRLDEAKSTLEKATQIAPNSPNTHLNLGTVYLELGEHENAEECFKTTHRLDPHSHQARMNLANLWQIRGRFQDAENTYEQLLNNHPKDALLWNNFGEALRKQAKWERAIKAFGRAMQLNPTAHEPPLSLARCFALSGRQEDAENLLIELIESHPSHARPHHYLGRLRLDQKRVDEAKSLIERALEIDPNDMFALNSLGFVQLSQGDRQGAESSFRRVIESDPTMAVAHSCLLFLMSSQPDFDQEELFREHQNWGRIHGDVSVLPSRSNQDQMAADHNAPNRRLRIGYVSPDLRKHAVASYFLPVLESHCPDKVETFCYAQLNTPDAVTSRFQELADHWRFTTGLSDEQVAQQIWKDQIDILVDLAGHTGDNRLRVFAFRPAPIQITWLGYPNTTGLEAMDYRITCEIQNPRSENSFHTETLIRMPKGSFCFSEPEGAPDITPLPALTGDGITFGSLHRPDKVSAKAISLWASVLKELPNSRLLLFHTGYNATSASLIQRQLVAAGVSEQQIEIQFELKNQHYLQVYNEIDIALDVTPWAGGTTTLEALWMGVPVVAYHGDRRSARSTAAIVNHVGHDWLIAKTQQEFSLIAQQLSGDLNRLSAIRKALRAEVRATITNGTRFTRELESVYRELWLRHCEQARSPDSNTSLK